MLGAAASALVLGAASALAGTGVGGIFNLGEKNAVNAASRLVGSVQAPQLAVTNANAGGSGLRALHSAGSGSAPGLWGDTGSSGGGALGVLGRVLPASAAASSAAVKGLNQGKGMGVYGRNPNNVPSGYGVVGEGRYGLVGRSLFSGASSGVWASSPQGFAGVEGHSGNAGGFGVYGQNTSGGPGVFRAASGRRPATPPARACTGRTPTAPGPASAAPAATAAGSPPPSPMAPACSEP
jgi:hypothetical protein